MATGGDIATSTSIGAGVAKTRINADASLLTPAGARNLVAVVPYLSGTGALTAAEGVFAEVAVESGTFNLMPKRMVNAGPMGGLGAFLIAVTPILESYMFNSPISGVGAIDYYGQAQVANTVAVELGVGVLYSDQSPSPRDETFYMKPTDETATGITATKVAGGTFTLSNPNGAMITDFYPLLMGGGVVTASESYTGFMSFESDAYDTAFYQRFPVQPIATAPGTAIGIAIPKQAVYHNQSVPTKTNATISTYLTLEEALTVAVVFIGGIGYKKR